MLLVRFFRFYLIILMFLVCFFSLSGSSVVSRLSGRVFGSYNGGICLYFMRCYNYTNEGGYEYCIVVVVFYFGIFYDFLGRIIVEF